MKGVPGQSMAFLAASTAEKVRLLTHAFRAADTVGVNQ